MTDQTFLRIFGLLFPSDPGEPQGEILQTDFLDHFRVDTYENAQALSCKCGRFNVICLHPEDFKKIRPVSGLYACPVCLDEIKTARTDSDRVAIWFRQNKATLRPEPHVHIPEAFSRLMSSSDKILMRPRRFVYSKFYDVELARKDKILVTCGDPNCVNPYHLMRAKSPAAKVTPEIREDVLAWTQKRLSSRMIQDLLEEKHKKSLSIRTISKIRSSALA